MTELISISFILLLIIGALIIAIRTRNEFKRPKRYIANSAERLRIDALDEELNKTRQINEDFRHYQHFEKQHREFENKCAKEEYELSLKYMNTERHRNWRSKIAEMEYLRFCEEYKKYLQKPRISNIWILSLDQFLFSSANPGLCNGSFIGYQAYSLVYPMEYYMYHAPTAKYATNSQAKMLAEYEATKKVYWQPELTENNDGTP